MEKQFIVSCDIKEKIISISNQSRDFPRVISKVNQQWNGWLISISGPDNEVEGFIDELKNSIDFDLSTGI
jgi:hypothetical protein